MTIFANYKNGEVTMNTHRYPDAMVTSVADILSAMESQSNEILTASIDTDDELQAIQFAA